MIKSYIRSVTYVLITWNLREYTWHVSGIIIVSSGIETNSGPKHSFSSQDLKIYHWNLSSLPYMYKRFIHCRPTFPSTNLIIFISQNPISPPKLHLMTTIWKYLVTTILETITHLTLNMREFAFIMGTRYLLNYLI